jgi:hypothetical protein
MTTWPSTQPSSFLRSQGEVRTLRISLHVPGNDPVAEYRTCPAFRNDAAFVAEIGLEHSLPFVFD